VRELQRAHVSEGRWADRFVVGRRGGAGEAYVLESLGGFDLFPQTSHVNLSLC
jgi:hypothetical protein